jgi:hypothetical protein
MKSGRSERIRTSDPLVPNEVRYRTALRSDTLAPAGAQKGALYPCATPCKYKKADDSKEASAKTILEYKQKGESPKNWWETQLRPHCPSVSGQTS